MDDSNKPSPHNNNESKIPFGMNAFGPTEREQFGQSVRLAMACIKAAPEPTKGCALPHDETAIRERLKVLSQEITSNHADLLELLVRFDDKQGWKSCGACHCAAWMNLELGISSQLGWEYLRVGRALQTLPTVQALFRVGSLSWSKVRLITRVANNENEKILCHSALDASVSEVNRLCEEYRWNEDENNDGENARAIQQWTSRAFTWNEASNGCTRIQLVLPPEVAQAFLNSVEQSLNQMDPVGSTVDSTVDSTTDATTDSTLTQRRADAAVLMAETSLQNAGKTIASADRYQVCVSIEASELATDEVITLTESDTPTDTPVDIPTLDSAKLPTKRPTLLGVGPIATETARRIACDCSLSINITNKSAPMDIGRKSRIWPNAMARTIKERDQHCVWPGCTHAHHLHIHHIKHWADGGATALHNGVCLCAYHHTLVHEGGYSIEHIAADSPQIHEQFIRQQHNDDVSLFDFEISLRNDQASFDTVRKLSPNRFQYEIRDAHGQIVSGRSDNDAKCAEQPAPAYVVQTDTTRFEHSIFKRAEQSESTRVDQSVSKQTEQSESTHVDQSVSKRAERFESTRVDQSVSKRTAQSENTSVNVNHDSVEHADAIEYARLSSENQCSEASPNTYYGKKAQNHVQRYMPAFHVQAFRAHAFTYETPSSYGMTA